MRVSYYWGTISELKEAYDVHRRHIMKEYALTALEVDIILFLANNPHFDTATAIVKERKISKSHVSETVKSLYKKGLLKRVEDERNSKLIHLQLTPLTEEMVRDGQREQKEFFKNIMDGFSEEEIKEFVHSLKRISDNIQKKYEW